MSSKIVSTAFHLYSKTTLQPNQPSFLVGSFVFRLKEVAKFKRTQSRFQPIKRKMNHNFITQGRYHQANTIIHVFSNLHQHGVHTIKDFFKSEPIPNEDEGFNIINPTTITISYTGNNSSHILLVLI